MSLWNIFRFESQQCILDNKVFSWFFWFDWTILPCATHGSVIQSSQESWHSYHVVKNIGITDQIEECLEKMLSKILLKKCQKYYEGKFSKLCSLNVKKTFWKIGEKIYPKTSTFRTFKIILRKDFQNYFNERLPKYDQGTIFKALTGKDSKRVLPTGLKFYRKFPTILWKDDLM